MINDDDGRPALWRLAVLPSCGVSVASLLWWYHGDLLRAVGLGFLVYCLMAAAVLVDSLYLSAVKNRAERARHRATKVAYDLFMRSVSGEIVGAPLDLPGMQRRSMTVRDPKQAPHEVVWWSPLDPQERAVRERLIQVCMWAWALQRPAAGVSGLESEVMVGEDLAFSRPADWVEASNALRDIGVVSKPGQGFKTTWAAEWTPRRAIAFIQSGVPLPLNYRRLRIAVRPRPGQPLDRPAPPPSAPPAAAAEQGDS